MGQVNDYFSAIVGYDFIRNFSIVLNSSGYTFLSREWEQEKPKQHTIIFLQAYSVEVTKFTFVLKFTDL
ncbi:unnamed protein product, partial [Ceratitis capitata]